MRVEVPSLRGEWAGFSVSGSTRARNYEGDITYVISVDIDIYVNIDSVDRCVKKVAASIVTTVHGKSEQLARGCDWLEHGSTQKHCSHPFLMEFLF